MNDPVTSSKMGIADKLRAIEEAWITGSDEEEFYFSSFPEPMKLRRSQKFPGALSALTFGTYQDLNDQWVQDDRVVWLSMIVSDRPGYAGRLLDALTLPLRQHGLALIGTPTALRPRDWDQSRQDRTHVDLVGWYMRHGFKVVQSSTSTRIVNCEYPLKLVTKFEFMSPP